jgi:hypothetical protein
MYKENICLWHTLIASTYHKIKDILPLPRFDEIVNKMQQKKYGNKPQHDLHITKEVKIYFCLLIIRIVNGHLH